MSETSTKTVNKDLTEASWLEIVRQQVGSLRFGVVEIVVHDSRVTQIEKTERLRLDKPATEARSHRD
ncbi:MAG TPA: YezD family protein [Verrucomicrobiae bacterium]|nr:YezD family protein [Verrucomicrobiae bacterium]